jgi:hypothetical protein
MVSAAELREVKLARVKRRIALFSGVVVWLAASAHAWGQEKAPIRRLDDPTRARVLAAVAALIILGFGMVLLTWLGARVTQRYRKGTSYLRPTRPPGEHDWAKRPLEPRNEMNNDQ